MSDCIRWPGRHRKGSNRPLTSENHYAYRDAWEAVHGPLAPGLDLHHTCFNAWCVNVEHLVPMTTSEHTRLHGQGGDWGQADKTHCPAGHEYTPENTYVYRRKDGSTERHCRICRRATQRRWRERRRSH